MTTSPHLQVVPSRRRGAVSDLRCDLAVQAIMCGPQDMRIRAMTAEAAGRDHGVIAVRVGRVLLYLEDRRSLQDWLEALQQAETYADKAYGPVLPPPSYQARM